MTKEEKIIEDLINKMFELAGHDVKYEDIKDRKDSWYNDWTMTKDQYNQWIEWGYDHIRKSKILRKNKAKQTIGWFGLNYGLKLSDDNGKV